MSTSAEVTPKPKRTFFRYWLPRGILILAAIAVAVLWAWPEELEAAPRKIFTIQVLMLTALLLFLWFLFFSRFPRSVRLGSVLVVILLGGAGVAALQEVQFTGDLMPVFVWRWQRTPDQVLEEHRRQQGEPVFQEAIDVSEDNPADCPEYRGRLRDGIVQGPALARDWKTDPPRQLWRQPVGGGYAAFAVAGNAVVTIEQRRDQEAVVCYDRDTGRERWVHSYPAFFKETLGGDGPRATPTISGGEVYSLGATGMLLCLDAKAGKVKWSVNILEDNDNIMWGMSGSPLVFDQFVVVNPGTQRPTAAGRALVAYDRANGKEVWRAGNKRAGYSSPMRATLAGRKQILLLDGESLAGYDEKTGQELWRFDWPAYQGINVAQPLVLSGDRVFISTGYNVGCAMLRISEKDGLWKTETLWQNKAMRCKFTSPVSYQGYLYGLDDGILACLDDKTGKRQWRDGHYDHGQLLLSGDLLVILDESGHLVLVEATPQAHRQLGRISALEGRTWNCLALAGGRAYVRNHQEMACYDLTDKQP